MVVTIPQDIKSSRSSNATIVLLSCSRAMTRRNMVLMVLLRLLELGRPCSSRLRVPLREVLPLCLGFLKEALHGRWESNAEA